jgi:hypothetical protein
MKKNSAARIQRETELGPAAAAVATHRRLSTATMLNSTRSRRPMVRGSAGTWVSGAAVDIAMVSS